MVRRLTTDEWIETLGDFIDWRKFELSSEYEGTRSPISIKCKRCKEDRLFNRASGLSEYVGEYACSKCDISKKVSLLESIDYAEKHRYKGRIIVLNKDSLKYRRDKALVKCSECGLEKRVLVSSYIAARAGCRECAGSSQLDTETVKKKISDASNGDYSLVGKYVNSQIPIRIRHESVDCNRHVWQTNLGNFIRHGRRCPKCTYVPSVGEYRISELLKRIGAKYTREYRDERCKLEKALPFDFAVYDKFDNLILLIEFDGIQHFSSERGFWGSDNPEEDLSRRVMADSVKDNFCEDNSIPLLRIRFDEIDETENIVKEKLLNIMVNGGYKRLEK